MLTRFAYLALFLPALAPGCDSAEIGDGGDPLCDPAVEVCEIDDDSDNPPVNDPADPSPVDCPSIELSLVPSVPTVTLLVDRSGSMDDPFGGTDRWQAVQDALTDPTNGVVAELENRVVFGAALYNSTGGSAGGACPILLEQPIGATAADIQDLFDAHDPDKDTPTGESLSLVANRFPASDGPRVIVLATDGEPDTCDQPNPQNGQALAVAAAQEAFDLGIQTFILSVGSDVSDAHLQDMANAGVGLEVGGAENAPFFKADNPDQLRAAFDEIITGVRECTVDLDGTVDPSRAAEGTVTLNGAPLEFGTDWQLVDNDTIELLGGSCDTLRNTDNVELQAEFPCGVIVL